MLLSVSVFDAQKYHSGKSEEEQFTVEWWSFPFICAFAEVSTGSMVNISTYCKRICEPRKLQWPWFGGERDFDLTRPVIWVSR